MINDHKNELEIILEDKVLPFLTAMMLFISKEEGSLMMLCLNFQIILQTSVLDFFIYYIICYQLSYQLSN